MDGAIAASSLGVVLQIVFLDLLLSGDNALVIALACRRLPAEQAKRAAWIGAAGAILLRLFLTLMTGALMTLPFAQLLSALPLLVIALNLMNGEDEAEEGEDAGRAEDNMLAAIAVIILSDAAMSLDNVVAVAAVSGGNFWELTFGFALSVPLIVFGSFGFSRVMQAYPWLADLGAGLLGSVAGGMIAGDPLFSGWIDTQAPALNLVLPLACAVFVVVQGRFARENAAKAKAKRRLKRPPAPGAVHVEAPEPALQPARQLEPKPSAESESRPEAEPAIKPEPEARAKALAAPAAAVSEDMPLPLPEAEPPALQASPPEAERRSIQASPPEAERRSLQASPPEAERRSLQASSPEAERRSLQASSPEAERRSLQASPPEAEHRSLQASPSEAAMPAMGTDEDANSDDRLMAYGMIGLFLIFGVFLLIFILMPD